MAPVLTTPAAIALPASRPVALASVDTESPPESVKDGFTTPEEKQDLEAHKDGQLRAYIDKHGEKVLVTWTHAEQRKVVRKADFLFLPIFTVSLQFFSHYLNPPNVRSF